MQTLRVICKDVKQKLSQMTASKRSSHDATQTQLNTFLRDAELT